MALVLIAYEKQSLTQKFDRKLPCHETLKSRSIPFIDDGADHYSSSCMSDLNFMALALIVSEKKGET